MFDQISSDAPAFDPESLEWLDISDPDPDRRSDLGTFADYFPEHGGEWSL
jgi:hypothetical protein